MGGVILRTPGPIPSCKVPIYRFCLCWGSGVWDRSHTFPTGRGIPQQGALSELYYLWLDGETEAKALQRYPRSPQSLEELDHWLLVCFFPELGVSSGSSSSLRNPQVAPVRSWIQVSKPQSQDTKCHLLPNL